MIKKLEIKNFKSIKHLQLDCKRVNLFIGKPNTGKSNLLESVGIFSLPYVSGNLKDLVRFEKMTNLFYDQDVNTKIEIIADMASFEITFENGKFKGRGEDTGKKYGFEFEFDHDGKGEAGSHQNAPFKFYRFAAMDRFAKWESEFLLPVKGENLLQMLLINKELRKVVAGLFGEYGFRMVLRTQEHKIEVQKELEETVVSYPYSLVSDTLQRTVFYLTAIKTN